MRKLPSCLLGALLLLSACAVPRPEAHAPARPPSPVTLRYLGVAGWELSDGSHTVLIDPYFSRPSLADGVSVQPDLAAIAARAPQRAELILISHSHVDHALDAAAVAQRSGAMVLGTESTA